MQQNHIFLVTKIIATVQNFTWSLKENSRETSNWWLSLYLFYKQDDVRRVLLDQNQQNFRLIDASINPLYLRANGRSYSPWVTTQTWRSTSRTLQAIFRTQCKRTQSIITFLLYLFKQEKETDPYLVMLKSISANEPTNNKSARPAALTRACVSPKSSQSAASFCGGT